MKKAIIEFNDNQVDFCNMHNAIVDYDIVNISMTEDYQDNILSTIDYDTAIIINNTNISYLFAYSTVKKHLKKQKNVICFYQFKEEDRKKLNKFASKNGTNIVFYQTIVSTDELFPIDVPIIYIVGMGINCGQFNMHLNLRDIFENKGIKTLNYSNSDYSEFFGIYNINKVVDILEMNSFDAIVKFNHSVFSKVMATKPEVIILSDVTGLFPYNAVIDNLYGIYNNILKYACPYDYVIYNIYADEYDETTLKNIISRVLHSIDKNTLCLGLGHYATTMAIAGLSDNDEFIKIVPEEYENLLSNIRDKSDYDVVNTLSIDDLEGYVKKLINN